MYAYNAMAITQTGSDTLNESFEVLSHPCRRRILTRLFESNPRDEDGFDPIELASRAGDPELVGVELHHVHLPKLAESGFIDWNRDENVIRRGPRFDEIVPLLRLTANYRDELPADGP